MPKTYKRVVVITNVILGYRRPIFESLSAIPDWQLRILLSLPIEKSDRQAQEQLPLQYTKSLNFKHRSKHKTMGISQVEPLPIPLTLLIDLWRFCPDIIISAEFGVRSILAYLYAWIFKIPFVIWSEATAEQALGISWIQRKLRAYLADKASAFLAWGRPAVLYLSSFNVPANKIYYCAQAVDNHAWSNASREYDKDKVKNGIGATGRVFLAVGRMLPLKGFDYFLRAWALLPEELRMSNTVVFVGSGSEENSLRSLAAQYNLPNVLFVGDQTADALAKYYAGADVLVVPSLVDVWGLVINEALACGLPVLASRYAGASGELIGDTGAGEVFDPHDIPAFTAMLERWCIKESWMSQSDLLNVVSRFDFNTSINAFKRVVNTFLD